MLCAQATADTARDVADKTWDRCTTEPTTIRSNAAWSNATRRSRACRREVAAAVSRLTPVRALPELFDVRIKARSIAYLFGAGAILGLLTLVFPHSPEVNDLALVLLHRPRSWWRWSFG